MEYVLSNCAFEGAVVSWSLVGARGLARSGPAWPQLRARQVLS